MTREEGRAARASVDYESCAGRSRGESRTEASRPVAPRRWKTPKIASTGRRCG